MLLLSPIEESSQASALAAVTLVVASGQASDLI